MDRFNYVNGDPVNPRDPDRHMVCNTDEPCAYRGRSNGTSASSSSSSADYGGSYGKFQDDQSGGASPPSPSSSRPQCHTVYAGRAGARNRCGGGSQDSSSRNGPGWALAGFAVGLVWDTGSDIVGGLKEVVTH